MKLITFSVKNFRSITNANKIKLGDTTVIVGKNNEGKSNLLKALSFAMNEISNHYYSKTRLGGLISRTSRRHLQNEEAYVWERDFPITLQERAGKKETTFTLEFELDEEEISEFKEEIKSSCNGILPIEIKIDHRNDVNIRVVKGGKANKPYNEKSAEISEFIEKRIFFNYIPAIRTHSQAVSAMSRMVELELSVLENDDKYIEAINSIKNLERPLLERLSKEVKEPLLEFLPNIRNVEISINDDSDRLYPRRRREFNFVIDDGTPTNIEYKGDGVKSLVALSLLKNRAFKDCASIIAIEEPESHLHSGAIHQLNEIIQSLEIENQVVITTHNPLFINRKIPKSNIIIQDGKAYPAENISMIRDVLGVLVSDNLSNAKYVLVVEGGHDKKVIEKILKQASPTIRKEIITHQLSIEQLDGAANLSSKLSMLQNNICSYHVFIDKDEEADKAIEIATDKGLLKTKNLTQTICAGLAESEMEDCFTTGFYAQAFQEEFGVELHSPKFKNSKAKWSKRLENCFNDQGKSFNKKILNQAKYILSSEIQKSENNAVICTHKGSSINALIKALEELVKK